MQRRGFLSAILAVGVAPELAFTSPAAAAGEPVFYLMDGMLFSFGPGTIEVSGPFDPWEWPWPDGETVDLSRLH